MTSTERKKYTDFFAEMESTRRPLLKSYWIKNWLSKPVYKSIFTRFIVSRHPLSRLYSGWENRLKINDPPLTQAKFWNLIKADEDDTGHAISWPRFVGKFIQGEKIDVHHTPITHMCPVCMPYEYHFKTETLDDDISFFTEKVVGKSFKKSVKANSGKENSDPSHFKKFCQFSDAVMEKIEDYYRYDYLLFSYDKFNKSICE